ncbi:helix-turn-helix domain-containing protein [Chryseobacterium mulctrae]|uniref:helix-turn-helix domain-containing protein n=1 Tax=Chryseobacterium mulctrae TaxID=2576777 RepID=UPI00139062E3|nr:helix-turn-helix domain-containing protein [Chryseobacterium mulctrae]
MNKSDKKARLVSPEYRGQIGKKLKQRRIELNFSINDIAFMTDITDNTVLSIEKGITTNIDYYVEYAKAVHYPLETLDDFKIKLVPHKALPDDRKAKANLTGKIRKCIVQSSFLNTGKTVAEIKAELINFKLIDATQVSSTEIAGVMRNFVIDGIVKIENKVGRKNIYIK